MKTEELIQSSIPKKLDSVTEKFNKFLETYNEICKELSKRIENSKI